MSASVTMEEHQEHHEQWGAWLLILLVPFSLLVIVIASVRMVEAALGLANVWRLPRILVGGGIIAGLTGLPNAYTATHRHYKGGGAAVVSARVAARYNSHRTPPADPN